MPSRLSREERMRLMRFVCSFAWADLEVRDAERKFIGKLIDRLGLEADEVAQVQQWLEVPPPAEEVDPTRIPQAHRALFRDAARALVTADGEVDEREAESLALLDMLMR